MIFFSKVLNLESCSNSVTATNYWLDFNVISIITMSRQSHLWILLPDGQYSDRHGLSFQYFIKDKNHFYAVHGKEVTFVVVN